MVYTRDKIAESQKNSKYMGSRMAAVGKKKTPEDVIEECRLFIAKAMPTDVKQLKDAKLIKEKTEQLIIKYVNDIKPDVEGFNDLIDLRQYLIEEITEYGPITDPMYDPQVDEIQVNGPKEVWIEKGGNSSIAWPHHFKDNDHLEKIIAKLARASRTRLTPAKPFINARTINGERINATHGDISPRGNFTITIRKFKEKKLTPEDLISSGAISKRMLKLASFAPRGGLSWIVAGPTGSGKTTLNEILAKLIPNKNRIITIENPAEYNLLKRGPDGNILNNVVSLEAIALAEPTPDDPTMQNLMENTLRQSPKWIGPGELRSPGEFRVALQAAQTGHWFFTTMHAGDDLGTITRFHTGYMAASNEPADLVLENICNAIKFIIIQDRLDDGTRKVMSITEVRGVKDNGKPDLNRLYVYELEDFIDGKAVGRHKRVGKLSPETCQILLKHGISRKEFEEFTKDPQDGEVESYNLDEE